MVKNIGFTRCEPFMNASFSLSPCSTKIAYSGVTNMDRRINRIIENSPQNNKGDRIER